MSLLDQRRGNMALNRLQTETPGLRRPTPTRLSSNHGRWDYWSGGTITGPTRNGTSRSFASRPQPLRLASGCAAVIGVARRSHQSPLGLPEFLR